MKRRSLLQHSLALAAAVAAPAMAQTASSGRPITIYVPYPAGGVSDGQSRTVAPHLSKRMGVPVVVENLTGASGSISANKMLSSPPDGHALMVVSPSETILAPMVIAGLKYRAEDFRLLAAGIVVPTVLVARPTLEADNVAALVALSQKKELSFGSIGQGSMPQLTAEDFRQRTGARLLHVPYRGGAPLVQDLMANQIDIAFMPFAGPLLGIVATGKAKIIGLVSPTRFPAYAQHPYVNDYPPLKDFNYPVWSTFAVSRAVPEDMAARLNLALNEVMQLPDVQAWVKGAGSFVPDALDLKGAADFYDAETRKIRTLAKAINLQPQ